MLVLGIETSCDETSVSVLDGEGRVLSSIVSSQVATHRRYGGVVPEIAARAHLANFPPLLTEALGAASASLPDVGLVAATAGPGLVGALLVGLCEGKGLAFGLGVPFVPVHHIEAHCLSPFLFPEGAPSREVPARFTALVVSGGHTHLFGFSPAGIERIGRTRDDAAGEAYDKVAKMAGLGYPGGPAVDRLARGIAPGAPFPVPHFKDGSLDFSFAGLKTAVKERLASLGQAPLTGVPDQAGPLPDEEVPPPVKGLLAAFQEAVVAQLEERLTRLVSAREIGLLSVSGGVAANSLLRERLPLWGRAHGVEVLLPARALTVDNAAMVAFAGARRHRGAAAHEGLLAPARSRWPLESLPA